MEVVNALGRRKSAVARIFVSEGTERPGRVLPFKHSAIRSKAAAEQVGCC